ncbi:protein BPS1, chloroplastic-like [Raphanus sativus]|uniref:Protein BPS1, chloroplastic-like n=1 Tax=Raphanus sativus TaxID=3726 RepID=A0A6J0L380_RAPSA|nr:protein BPS1, chloroplastic-like [Raphanus sativus]
MFFSCLFPKKNNACISISPQLLFLVNRFEISLTKSIAELVPEDDNDKDDFLNFSWMITAMHSLCETHLGFTALMTTDVDLPVSDMEESLIEMYVDISSKLLELCDAFTSELHRLNHGNMFLNVAFSNPEEFDLSQVDRWKQYMASKNPSIENCGEVLRSLIKSLNRHHHRLYKKVTKKKKKSQDAKEGKEKVLLRSLYGAMVNTLYIFSVFAAAFTRSSKNLLHLTITKEMEEEEEEEVRWGQAFVELQNKVNLEIQNTSLSESFGVIRDLEAVESGVEKLYAAVQEGCPDLLMVMEPLKQSVKQLSERYDLIYKATRCLWDEVSLARDVLSERLLT